MIRYFKWPALAVLVVTALPFVFVLATGLVILACVGTLLEGGADDW